MLSGLYLFLIPFLSVFFLSSAQVPDNDEQFVPDYQAESCKYCVTRHYFFVFLFKQPVFSVYSCVASSPITAMHGSPRCHIKTHEETDS